MDLDRVYLILKTATAVSFAALAVVVAGELLGWWQDFGELAGLALAVISALLAVITFLFGATRGQVVVAVDGILAGNGKLDAANGKLDALNLKMDDANGRHDVTNRKLDDIASILRDIRDRPPGSSP